MAARYSAFTVIYNIPYTVLVKRFCVGRGGLCSAMGWRCRLDGECWKIFAAVRGGGAGAWGRGVGCQVFGSEVGSVPGYWVSGWGRCRVARVLR